LALLRRSFIIKPFLFQIDKSRTNKEKGSCQGMIDKGEYTYKECSDKKCSPVNVQKTQGKKILQMDHKRYTELQKTKQQATD